jgi:hypothetical protein
MIPYVSKQIVQEMISKSRINSSISILHKIDVIYLPLTIFKRENYVVGASSIDFLHNFGVRKLKNHI